MDKAKMITGGIALILVGAMLILVQLGMLPWRDGMLWPVIMLGAALLCHIKYFASGRKKPGVLVPGGILAVYGLLLLALAWLDRAWAERLVGVWVLGPALGLAELAMADRKKKGIWIAAGVLTAVGMLILLWKNLNMSPRTLLGAALIVIGLVLVFGQNVILQGRKIEEKSHECE